MPVFNIIDTEIVGADTFKENLFPILEIPFGVSNSFYTSDREYTSEGTALLLREKAYIEISPSITVQFLEELAQQNEGASFLSHKMRLSLPDPDDQETFNYNNYVTDAYSYYNLKNEDYELYTEANNEKTLPNFCLGALWDRGEETAEQQNYYTMFGSIPSLVVADILAPATPINNYEFDGDFLSEGSFFGADIENITDYYKQFLLLNEGVNSSYQNANTHIYVDFDYNLNDTAKIGNTPFFNRIRLPNADPRLELPFLSFGLNIKESFTQSSMTHKLIKSFRNSNSFLRNFDINGNTTQLKVYDLLELIDGIGYNQALTETDEMFLRSETQNYAEDNNNPFSFYFYKLLLLGKIRNSIRGRIKGFKQLIVDNEDHETEHVGFKVIKRIQGRVEPIQSFYFLNRDSLEDFIDTQIRFDRVYTYEVIGMFAVYGTNYTYEDIEIQNPPSEGGGIVQGRFLRIDFVARPSVKIVEVPMATHTLRVVEPPPIVPEITFYNEMTTKNKLKIRMEHQDGNIVDEYRKLPMRPFADNQVYIDKLKQYFGGSDNILVTSGKTSDGIYEIYRLEEPPSSYRDFEGALIATVQSSVIYSNGEQSRNAMFTDLIRHQKKYYYAFRVLTHRGNPSELSDIYVAEMYEDADETFLTFDLYQIPENKNFQPNSHMRKYIQIIPNQEHLIPNAEEIIQQFPNAQSAITALKLGQEDLQEKLFEYNNQNKYIKLRLESKNSGRKMDINLFFKRKTTNN